MVSSGPSLASTKPVLGSFCGVSLPNDKIYKGEITLEISRIIISLELDRCGDDFSYLNEDEKNQDGEGIWPKEDFQ